MSRTPLAASAIVAVLAALALAGCGADPIAERDEAAPPAETAATEPDPAPAAAGRVRLARVASVGDGLLVTAAPGQPSRLFVVQQSGQIRIVQRGRLLARPFLDVSGLITSGGERGLLGLAFHPGYARNGRLFVNYTDEDGDTRVVEYRRASATSADPGSARVLLTIAQPFPNHNGGHLAFGPDGYLYIGMGDGGGSGDPFDSGQRLDTLLGKLLRIDVDGRTGGRPYAIPADNPYRAGGGRPEIYSYGLRNPWRFSFDRARGDLWIGDVGQNAVEEVNFRRRGAARGVNFGWNAFEGRRPFAGAGAIRGRAPVFPVAQYGHDKGCSVTGGHVSRSPRAPGLRGRYVFADFCSGRVWSMRAGPRPGGLREETGRLNVRLSDVTSFGEGLNGDLYVIGSGNLYRFVR